VLEFVSDQRDHLAEIPRENNFDSHISHSRGGLHDVGVTESVVEAIDDQHIDDQIAVTQTSEQFAERWRTLSTGTNPRQSAWISGTHVQRGSLEECRRIGSVDPRCKCERAGNNSSTNHGISPPFWLLRRVRWKCRWRKGERGGETGGTGGEAICDSVFAIGISCS